MPGGRAFLICDLSLLFVWQTALSLRYGNCGRIRLCASVARSDFRELTLHRTGQQSELILGAEPAAMRQIAWELVQTLDEHDQKTK
jgi:hypothetical protein